MGPRGSGPSVKHSSTCSKVVDARIGHVGASHCKDDQEIFHVAQALVLNQRLDRPSLTHHIIARLEGEAMPLLVRMRLIATVVSSALMPRQWIGLSTNFTSLM